MARESRSLRSTARVTVVNFLLASFILLFLFSVRPMRLASELRDAMGRAVSEAGLFRPTESAAELIKVEHQKAIDEIRLRVELEDSWFHYKFLLVGALIAFFLKAVWLDGRGEGEAGRAPGSYATLASAHAVLALACVLALSIDIHIRNNITVIHQLALWISDFVEPTLLQATKGEQLKTGFMPWEQFLRNESGGEGMHRDAIYGFAFYPHLHIITWLLYLAYLWALHRAYLSERAERRQALWAGYAAVHLTFFAFTWLAHAAPGAFERKVFPWVDWWAGGVTSAAVSVGFWALLLLVNWWCLRLLRPAARARAAQEGAAP